MNFVYFFFCCLGVPTLLLLEPANGGSPVYDYSYIQNPCDTTNSREITLGANGYRRYGYIEADNDGCYNPYPNCHIKLTVPYGYQITVRFDWINIEISDELVIKEASQTHSFVGIVTPPFSYFSTSNWMNLSFLTYYDALNCFGGFRLYYTSFHHGECADNEFRCALDGRCIPNELKCDRNDNCGDWSDEWSGTCGLSTGAIIAISVTCAVVGIALIASLFYCLYRKSYRRSAEDHSHPQPPRDHVRGAEPIGPPKYSDVPPPYGLTITTNSNPVYEDLDHHGGVIPPTYNQSTFTTAPYNVQNHSVAHYDNDHHAYTTLVHNNTVNNSNHGTGHM